MSLSRIDSNSIAANAISTADLADGSITSVKISGIIPLEKGGTGLSSVGLAGNVLTSNGTAFVSQELIVPSNGHASVQVFTAVGNVTYTKPDNLVRVKVTVVGGGGGGGSGLAGGGGAGGGAIKFIPAPSIPGPVTVTIGQGGLKQPGGTSGNTSSFGAFCSATGGVVGGAGSGQGGFGGIGSDGDINTRGGRGGSVANAPSGGGSGGVSLFGGGGPTVGNSGSGGEGVGPITNGGNGIVVVEEFF